MSHSHGDYYGHFNGGDPRRFHPDGDVTTEDERTRHRLACEGADADERRGIAVNVPGFGVVGPGYMAQAPGFGIGVYSGEPCTNPLCDENRDEPGDPDDGPAHLARYMEWDFEVNLPEGVTDATKKQFAEVASAAFIAGFRARESDPPPARVQGEAST